MVQLVAGYRGLSNDITVLGFFFPVYRKTKSILKNQA
jgi:hypothetical protein